VEEIPRPSQAGDGVFQLFQRRADFSLGNFLPLGLNDLIEKILAHKRC
jgi:hypothetical protein